jgi:6-phosphogluconate dehydrogenase
MGISSGISGTHHGPSLMPGGDERTLDQLPPLSTKIAAKDDHGQSCVTKVGAGGSGHYVKMIHNGIEHGMMSALREAWELMDRCLGIDDKQIRSVFDT